MRKVMMIVLAAVVLIVLWLAFCGFQWSWGPFSGLHDLKTRSLPGNASLYAPEHVETLPESPLKGKHILYLGSSVTFGAAARGISFADYITRHNGSVMTKEAVSGTTLVDSGPDSYVARLKRLDPGLRPDLVVCQLSTNDATQQKQLGGISEAGPFDTRTVAGAIEFIIQYVQNTWRCPVVFSTNPRSDSEAYGNMVDLLLQIAEKWDVPVIDLWNDAAFNAVSEEKRALWMADPIHPTQAGYLEWWTPYMETTLYRIAGE